MILTHERPFSLTISRQTTRKSLFPLRKSTLLQNYIKKCRLFERETHFATKTSQVDARTIIFGIARDDFYKFISKEVVFLSPKAIFITKGL